MKEILASFFHILYLWTVAFLFPLWLSFVDFLIRFFFLVKCFFLYTFGVLRGALHFQYDLIYLLKNKK